MDANMNYILKKIEDLYGISAVLVEQTQVGFDNETYKLYADGKNYFLSGNKDYDVATLRKRQFHWVDHLKASNLPVIEVLKTLDNETGFYYSNYYWYLMCEAKGSILTEYNSEQAYRLGYVTGLLHKVSKNYNSDEIFDFNYYKKDIHHWQDIYQKNQSLFSEKENAVIEEKFTWCHSFEVKNIPFYIVHNDLFRSNILWDQNKIACIIDFNSSRVGYYTEDFGKAFDSVIKDTIRDNPNPVRFMEGYQVNNTIEKHHISSIIFFLIVDLLKIIACWCRDFEKINKAGKHPKDLVPHLQYMEEKETFLYTYV